MKSLAGSIVFVLALLLGIAAALTADTIVRTDAVTDWNADALVRTDAPASEDTLSAPLPNRIHVAYTGFEPAAGDNVPYLKFLIYNGYSVPVAYNAHSPENPIPKIKANGNELASLRYCGTGMRAFKILPGSSAEVYVNLYHFRERPAKDDHITVGFYLTDENRNGYTLHDSAPFVLPEEFRRSIAANN